MLETRNTQELVLAFDRRTYLASGFWLSLLIGHFPIQLGKDLQRLRGRELLLQHESLDFSGHVNKDSTDFTDHFR